MRSTFFLFPMVLFLAAACMNKTADTPETSEIILKADSSAYKMITARITIKPEYVADFVTAAESLIDSSNMEPGCISYMLYQDPYNQTRFIFVEEWADQAAIDAHFNMSYYIAFGPKVEEWQSAPVELKIIDAVLDE